MLSNDTEATTFAITDTKLYALVVTLSTQYNAKLFEQLKPYFKRTINWNKYKSKVSSTKHIFRFLNESKFSRSKYAFSFIV